eukprot:GFUD01002674.1.p1 GENE.GFUD01002674.1~~GFUD01002674.1.p1  ORF type:complete len:225 (-),score=62.82 GFUD01002674.1:6-680(-)
MFSAPLTRLVTGLRLTSSRFPVVSSLSTSSCSTKTTPLTPCWSPLTMSICKLRTAPPSPSRSQVETKLSPNQSIMTEESELRSETLDLINKSIETGAGRLFAVVHVRGIQFKVTQGDLVMVQTDMGAPVGASIVLNKLLALGSQDFTLLGRPVLPRDLASVEATVIEKTLSRTKVVQKFKRRERARHIHFQRSKWTLLRVNLINVTGRVGETLDSAGTENILID